MLFLKEPHWSKPKRLRPAPPDSGSGSAEPDVLQKAPATFRSKNAGRFHFVQVHRRYSADKSQWPQKAPFCPTSEQSLKVWQTIFWTHPLGYGTKKSRRSAYVFG